MTRWSAAVRPAGGRAALRAAEPGMPSRSAHSVFQSQSDKVREVCCWVLGGWSDLASGFATATVFEARRQRGAPRQPAQRGQFFLRGEARASECVGFAFW